MNIYHKLNVSYIIRYVIIKHALVKEFLILQVQNDDINLDKNALLSTNHNTHSLTTRNASRNEFIIFVLYQRDSGHFGHHMDWCHPFTIRDEINDSCT